MLRIPPAEGTGGPTEAGRQRLNPVSELLRELLVLFLGCRSRVGKRHCLDLMATSSDPAQVEAGVALPLLTESCQQSRKLRPS